MPRHVTDRGRQFVAAAEGLRLAAYQDPAGVWTIGYGHTAGAHAGQRITQDQADALLQRDLAQFEAGIERLITADLTDDQFDALVSWAFNVGLGAVEGSTLRRRLNRDEDVLTVLAEELPRWRRAGGQVLRGLERRRAAEVRLAQGAADPWQDSATDSSVTAEPDVRQDLRHSRTIQGSAVAVLGQIAQAGIPDDATAQIAQAAAIDWSVARYAALALTLIGIAVVVYARIRDHQEGRR